MDKTILAMTSPTVSPEISGSVESSVVNLDFDYLDRWQGMLVQLMHTGPQSAEVAVKGSIRGGGVPREREEEPWWMYFLIVVALAVAVGTGALGVGVVKAFNGPRWLEPVVAVLGGIGGFALVLFLITRFETRITRVPRALSGFRLPRLEKRPPGAQA